MTGALHKRKQVRGHAITTNLKVHDLSVICSCSYNSICRLLAIYGYYVLDSTC